MTTRIRGFHFSNPDPTLLQVQPRVQAKLNSKQLRKNFRTISKIVPKQKILPMIKADGYGHGAAWIARELSKESKLHGFGVATLLEAIQVREALGNRPSCILVFSEGLHWTRDKGQICQRWGLTPVIASLPDWKLFTRQNWHTKIPFHLKFNTGMNRLGIEIEEIKPIVRFLKKHSQSKLKGVLSHLSLGEDPHHRLSKLQLKRFLEIHKEFKSVSQQIHLHLANSAAIWNHHAWKLNSFTDIVRPGISLYGVRPWEKAQSHHLKPIMTLTTQVLQIHQLKKGDCVGYGARFKAKKTERIAILAAGYADGVHRSLTTPQSSRQSLGNQTGKVWLSHRTFPMVGTVSMDLLATRCSKKTKVGDWAELWGPHIDPWDLAKAAQTVPYELLTSVAAALRRVNRIYE